MRKGVVCYREDVGRTSQEGGIAIYSGKGADMKPVFQEQLDEALGNAAR